MQALARGWATTVVTACAKGIAWSVWRWWMVWCSSKWWHMQHPMEKSFPTTISLSGGDRSFGDGLFESRYCKCWEYPLWYDFTEIHPVFFGLLPSSFCFSNQSMLLAIFGYIFITSHSNLSRTLYISKLEFNIANHVSWLEPGAILYTYICICICKYLLQFVSALKTLFIFIPTYIHAYIHACIHVSIYLSGTPPKPTVFTFLQFFLSFLVAFEVPRTCN